MATQLTTSQRQAIATLLPVLSFLLAVGWFPKKYRKAAEVAIGALQVITDVMLVDAPSELGNKAALLGQAALAEQRIGTSFSPLPTT